jgi:hypothetical protein
VQVKEKMSHRNVMRNNKTLVICSLTMQSVKENLVAAFRYLLKPLVRLALKNSVAFPDFSEALKKAYVDVAARQMVTSKMDVTEEGISLISSIPVSEVRVLLRAGDDMKYGRAAQAASPMPKILGAWHTDPKYTGPYGVLRDLEFARSAASADRSSETFTDLVLTYCPDVTPQVILDELMRIGAVQDVGNGFYRATRRSYVPDSLSAENVLYVARVVHNLCETLEFNLRQASTGGKGLIERSIFTRYGIPKGDHPAFDKFIRDRGQAFSDDIDDWITSRDVEGIKDAMQIGVGFYHYIVNEDDESVLTKELPN